MKIVFILAVLSLTFGMQAQPPSNDNCVNATQISSTSGYIAFGCGTATMDGTASCATNPAPDVWFRYTAPDGCPALFTVTSCDTDGRWGIDVVLSLHASCGGPELACSDNDARMRCGNTRDAYLEYPIQGGESVLLRVANAIPPTHCQVELHFGITPHNDACAQAIRIGDGSTPVCFISAETDGFPSSECAANGLNDIPFDVWYIYTASCDGFATADLCQASCDTRLAVYATDACPSAATPPLVCRDDDCDLQSRATFNVVSGASYRIRLGGFCRYNGVGTLVMSCAPCPCDWNHAGMLNSQDFFDFLTSFFANDADFNKSGNTDTQDFADFVACFTGGC